MDLPGWRVKHIPLKSNDAMCIFSREGEVILQVRRNLRSDSTNLLDPSFKSAVKLNLQELHSLLSELLILTAQQVVGSDAWNGRET